ncbi:MAG: hypothetical protein GW949_07920 [Spirochaetales bacterium]|nr:hypothetical protein [Spirochaetales bacterium]
MRSGRPNPFFEGRIRAVVDLFEKEKIRQVVASGSEDLPFYSEPGAMKEALLSFGIPETSIIEDGEGDDTFQSIYKMGQVYGSESFIIVTQEFHSFRALFIADTLGLNAEAYGIPNIGGSAGISMGIRESLARVKAFLDILIYRWQGFYE